MGRISVSTLERSRLSEPVLLAHGLENLDGPARADIESSLNMLRD